MLKMRPRNCPVCGSADESQEYAPPNIDPARFDAYSFASRKLPEYMHYRLIECPTCDLVYANPVPVMDSLVSAYEDAAFDSQVEARLAALTYAKFLPGIANRLTTLSGVMDIGAGDGAFLVELIAAGFTHVVGIEPSRAPVDAAPPDVKPLIRQEMFKADTVSPGTLSLVTCFQTIEHVEDPLWVCKEAWRALRPGGAVFLVGHNRRSFSAKLLGRHSPIFDVEHLQLFSRRSFKELMHRADFEDVSIVRLVNRYPLSYWAKLCPFPAAVKKSLTAFLSRGLVGQIVLPVPAGNLAVVAYKPSE